MPSGSTAPVPRASLLVGTPNSMIPPSPSAAASEAALRSESRECCTTPGMLLIGVGPVAPSRTKTGRMSCRASSEVSATSRRRAGVRRSRRGRTVGNRPVEPVETIRSPGAWPTAASRTAA